MDKAKEIESRLIRIKLIDGSSISGQVNIKREPGHDRLSDLVGSNRENFLVVVNATLHEKSLDNPVRHKTIFVNKDHILYATPEDAEK